MKRVVPNIVYRKTSVQMAPVKKYSIKTIYDNDYYYTQDKSFSIKLHCYDNV